MAAHPPAKPHDDAFHAIATIGSWVNNADTKLGFLATATTVLTVAVVHQRRAVELLLDQDVHTRGWLAVACLAVCAAALVLTAVGLFRGLRPRLANPSPTRFSFPHVAGADVATLVAADPATVREEAWTQAKILSEIVAKKYGCFRQALTSGTVAGVAFIGWLVLLP